MTLYSALVQRQTQRKKWPRHFLVQRHERRKSKTTAACGATGMRKTTRDPELVTCEPCATALKLLAGVLIAIAVTACGDNLVAKPDAGELDAPACAVADDAQRATCRAAHPGADAFTCALKGFVCDEIEAGVFCCRYVAP